MDEVSDTLVLLTSELTTNALLHAGTQITVTISVSGALAEVGVADRDPRPPVPRPEREDLLADLDRLPATEALPPDDRHADWHVGPGGSIAAGRGLLVLAALADEWGVATRSVGKEVWFTVAASAPPLHLRHCPCDGVDGFPAGSGRRVVALDD